MPDTLALDAPAKLNLFLHVVGRRPDGYHELQTFFVFVDLCDRIELQRTADGSVERSNEVPGVVESEDLVVRAAHALRVASGACPGVRIGVDKRIPMGGGLGGGSSDAAAVLLGLNRLWGLGWPASRLAEIGLRLGADVPVFVHGQAGFAEGVGERLTPVLLDPGWFVIVQPRCHVSTAEIFAAPELTRDAQRLTIRDFLAGGRFTTDGKPSVAAILAATRNDCEPVARARHPLLDRVMRSVAQTLRELRVSEPAEYRESVLRMTGTGACCFVTVRSEAAGQRLQQQLRARLASTDAAVHIAHGATGSAAAGVVPA
ncbi:MAG: 4-(cytidine 5'-diphospho)-2-C-methyl-D-erythritol kinase [Gammaproteobacteria bacterium]|nr:4-(cytidine 5'-diphospho)-2-C-methyl-D-erythritol kinase [Gammaproteobacteria bacterium]